MSGSCKNMELTIVFKHLTNNQVYEFLSVFPLQSSMPLPLSFKDYPILKIFHANRIKRALTHEISLQDRKSIERHGSGKYWEWKSRADKVKDSKRRHDSVVRSAFTCFASKTEVENATTIMERGLLRDGRMRPKSTLLDYSHLLFQAELRLGEKVQASRSAIPGRCNDSSRQWLAYFSQLSDFYNRSMTSSAFQFPMKFSFSEFSTMPYLFLAEYYRLPFHTDYSPKKALDYLLKCPSDNPVVLRDLAYINLFRNPFSSNNSINTALRTLFVTSRAGDGFSSFLAGRYYFRKKEYKLSRLFFDKGVSNADERCLEQIGNRIWQGLYPKTSKFSAIRYFERCPRSPSAHFMLAKICESLGQNKEEEAHLLSAAMLGSFDAMEYYSKLLIKKRKKNYLIRRYIISNQRQEDKSGFYALVNFRLLTITGCDGSATFYLNQALRKGHPLATLYERLYYTHSLPRIDF